MENPKLNYNEYLKYTFAGGIEVLVYLLLNPEIKFKLIEGDSSIKNSLFIILISLLLGSFLYSVHRAILYPICLKINYIILRLSKRIKPKSNWINFVFSQEYVKKHDFRRWKERQNTKSFSNNLVDWHSQIHFLYCAVWAISFSIILSLKNTIDFFILQNWFILTSILLLIAFRSHYRSLLYDIDVAKNDKLYRNNKKENTSR